MKKLFTEPVMSISRFNSENIVTTSGLSGTSTAVDQITEKTNAIIKADWAADGSTLDFTF